MNDYSTKSLIDSIISESKDSTFDRALALSYIQDTQDAVLGRYRFKFNEDRVTDSLSIGENTYEYDTDHQQIIQLVLVDSMSLSNPKPVIRPNYLPSDEFFDMYPIPEINDEAAPYYYTDYAGEIVFNCPCDKTYDFSMRFVVAPDRLSDSVSSQPQIPVEFKNILKKGGLAGIERHRENFDIAAVYERAVEDLSEDMLGRYGLRKMQPGKARTSRRVYGKV